MKARGGMGINIKDTLRVPFSFFFGFDQGFTRLFCVGGVYFILPLYLFLSPSLKKEKKKKPLQHKKVS
jgi:hypothetical protein